MRMESSEEEDDFPAIESVTPQSNIDTVYQSKTEKGIRKICFELLDLKDAVENLCGNTQTKYSAILRLKFNNIISEHISSELHVGLLREEVVEVEHELSDLQKHISGHRFLLHDLMTGVSQELEEYINSKDAVEQDKSEHMLLDSFSSDEVDHRMTFLENIDVLLVERKIDEVIEAIDAEERNYPELKIPSDVSATGQSSYRTALLKRKSVLANQLVEIAEQPFISIDELKKALSGLLKLGKGSLAHQLLLKSHGSRLQKYIEAFLPLCPCYPETYSASLSNLVFSSILLTTKESALLFGDNPVYVNKIVHWAEWEIESFVRLTKEHAPASDTASALHAVSVCVQASLNHCAALEPHGLMFSNLLLVLLQPYVEEVLELNFRRARKQILDFSENDGSMPLSPRFASPLTTFATSSESELVQSGLRFIFVIREMVEQLTHLVILHFGGSILTRISQLFDRYVDVLIKALPSTSEDDNLTDLKDSISFKAETDSQQFALLGAAFTIAEELLPMVVSKVWNILNESKEAGIGLPENSMPSANNTLDLKDWRRQLQHSLDKLKNYFCRQYVISFIYSRDDNTRLDAKNYLRGEKEDLFWVSDPLPSLPFQALFAKLQQLATVAGDVLLGREKVQKLLLARLTETVVMWLSQEQEFWSILEEDSALRPLGLQQLILDMHFTVEIARYAGYPCRSLHQMASAINARAIRAFSAKGVDPQSALPEDEWFVETAKNAINKFLHVASASDTSDSDEEHIMMHDDEVNSDSDASPSSLSSVESSESFASAEMGDLETPVFSDPES